MIHPPKVWCCDSYLVPVQPFSRDCAPGRSIAILDWKYVVAACKSRLVSFLHSLMLQRFTVWSGKKVQRGLAHLGANAALIALLWKGVFGLPKSYSWYASVDSRVTFPRTVLTLIYGSWSLNKKTNKGGLSFPCKSFTCARTCCLLNPLQRYSHLAS